MTRSLRPHLLWAALAVVAVPALWWAWSIPGLIVMCACLAVAFLIWNKLGSRGSWVALIVLGLGMGGILGWQAVTGERCPPGDTKVFLEPDEPPVGCDEIRASAGSMSLLFLMIAAIGVAAPFYKRMLDRLPDEDEDGPDPVA